MKIDNFLFVKIDKLCHQSMNLYKKLYGTYTTSG